LNDTWRTLHAKLSQLSEQEVKTALDHERHTLKRASIMQRLHQRYCTLRTARERIEILKEAVKP